MTATDLAQPALAWKHAPLFTREELQRLDPEKIPEHIAIIPDGNRRWARSRFVLPEDGHKMGADVLLNVIQAGQELGVQTLSFYIFSTENWSRPYREIKAQIWLLEKSLIEQQPRMLANGVRFQTIGELGKFPERTVNIIQETIEATKNCRNIDVVFAMNYGGRDEMVRAIKKIADDCKTEKLQVEQITENLIPKYLDTAPWKDPDMLIRTSGESRISNFLLWQISYTELYLTPVLWPDFTPHHLLDAVYNFQERERRLGGK